MAIVTYVLEAALEHRDSMGNGSVIRPGDVQYMSAGTGVTPSEFNASKTEPLRPYQIWMFPEKQGLKPAYDQKNFSEADERGKLRLIASPDGRDGSVKIRQDNVRSRDPRQRQAERQGIVRRRWRGPLGGTIYQADRC